MELIEDQRNFERIELNLLFIDLMNREVSNLYYCHPQFMGGLSNNNKQGENIYFQ